jgi:hypothetical protein
MAPGLPRELHLPFRLVQARAIPTRSRVSAWSPTTAVDSSTLISRCPRSTRLPSATLPMASSACYARGTWRRSRSRRHHHRCHCHRRLPHHMLCFNCLLQGMCNCHVPTLLSPPCREIDTPDTHLHHVLRSVDYHPIQDVGGQFALELYQDVGARIEVAGGVLLHDGLGVQNVGASTACDDVSDFEALTVLSTDQQTGNLSTGACRALRTSLSFLSVSMCLRAHMMRLMIVHRFELARAGPAWSLHFACRNNGAA